MKHMMRSIVLGAALATVTSTTFAPIAAADTSFTIGLHNSVAEVGDASVCPATGAYWHFVLVPNAKNTFDFTGMTLDVAGVLTTIDNGAILPNGRQVDNVFVRVPVGATAADLRVAGSVATYTSADDEPATWWNLSYTCDDPDTTTTSSTTTSTTTTSTTTTSTTSTSTTSTSTTTTSTTTTSTTTTSAASTVPATVATGVPPIPPTTLDPTVAAAGPTPSAPSSTTATTATTAATAATAMTGVAAAEGITVATPRLPVTGASTRSTLGVATALVSVGVAAGLARRPTWRPADRTGPGRPDHLRRK